MVDLSYIDSQTTIKQNYAGEDIEESNHPLVFKERLKIWNKITRVSVDGIEKAVIVPFDTFIETFYSEEDINTDESTGVFDQTNNVYRLYPHINKNYKTLVSKYITWQHGKSIDTITVTVIATDANDNTTDKFDLYIHNGNEWITVKDGYPIKLVDNLGADLDADLDATLGGQYDNLDEDGLVMFQNKIKYMIDRPDNDEVVIKRIIIKFTWKDV